MLKGRWFRLSWRTGRESEHFTNFRVCPVAKKRLDDGQFRHQYHTPLIALRIRDVTIPMQFRWRN
jgi:hypothetical protein